MCIRDRSGAVDVGHPDAIESVERCSSTVIAPHERDHGAFRRGGGTSHGRAAHADESRAVFDREETRGDECAELTEAVTEQVARSNTALNQVVVADDGQGEGGDLRARCV